MTLDNIKLPSLPRAYLALSELVNDPAATLEAVAHTVSSDPALAARTIKMAASGVYSPRFGGDVSALDAVRTLGMRRILDLSLATSVLSVLKTPASLGGFWDTSVEVSAWAAALARTLRKDAGTAQLAGLLHKIGVLVIAANVPADKLPEQYPADTEAERALFGVDHLDAGGRLLEYWNLPDVLSQPAKHYLSETPPIQPWTVPLVFCAVRLTKGAALDDALSALGVDSAKREEAEEQKSLYLAALRQILS